MIKNILTITAIILAGISLIISASSHDIKATNNSLAEKVLSKGELRIGYIVYPPALSKDEKTGKLSGFSYDIVEAAAKKLNLKTKWVEEVGWGTALEGLKTKRYDILGTQMWPNSARAREAVFSIAPMYSVIYPYVKTGDDRFTGSLEKLNSNEFTISALDGEMSSIIAHDDYPKAKTVTLPQTSSLSEALLNIDNGKADIIFIEPSVANDFLKSHPSKIVKAGGTPVRKFGNSFAFVRGEESMVSMWNIALGELINDGTVTRILQKYNVSGDYSLK